MLYNRFLISLILCLNSSIVAFSMITGDVENVKMQPTHGKGMVEAPIPLDQPDVYFDEGAMVLTIVGWDSTLPSYGVEVADACSNIVVSTTISGYGTDYVYLPASMCSGEATIIVSTPSGNEYEGTFTVP